MAGNGVHCLASQLSASATRLKANINSVIRKYDRHFEDDDLISLASLSVSKLSSKGTLRKIKDSHTVGKSNLKSTKRKDELMKLKLGLGSHSVDLNVSRAIERECASAFSHVDKTAANEPSDAETLSSFDDEEDSDSENKDEQFDSCDRMDNLEGQSGASDDERLSDKSNSLDSSTSFIEESNAEKDKYRVSKNGTITIDVSDDSEDDCRDEVHGTAVHQDVIKTPGMDGSGRADLNFTYVLDSLGTTTQQINQDKRNVGEEDSYVTLSSPRPKVVELNVKRSSAGRDSPLLQNYVEAKINKLSSTPSYSNSGSAFVVNKRKHESGETVIKYDGLFKNPQGIKIRRIAPVPVVPTYNHVDHLPKHSSYSSGFSSGSSIGHGDSHLNSKMESIQPGNNFHSAWKKPHAQPHHQSNRQYVDNNSFQIKANRVDQWVDMVNMNSTARDQLHYSSCPPKVLKSVSQQTVQSSQKSSTPPSSPQHKRNIGIQTTLNCTIQCTKKLSPPRKIMRDASTLLSDSFLDIHSPSHISKTPHGKKHGKHENCSSPNDENIMFPEEYIYKFSPLNPNRIDSDYSVHLHQDQSQRQDVKHFRPRRNEKRVREGKNSDLFSARHSKFRKLDDSLESMSGNLMPQDSFSLGEGNGTYVIHPSAATYKESSFSNYKRCHTSKPHQVVDHMHSNSHHSKFVSRVRNLANQRQRHCSETNCSGISIPLRLDEYAKDIYNVVNSTFDEIGLANDSINNENWISPKLAVFLNSSKSNRSNGRLQSSESEEEENLNTSVNSLCSRTFSKVPHSFISPVKVNISTTPSPERAKLRNCFNYTSANSRKCFAKNNSVVLSSSTSFKDPRNFDSEQSHVRNTLDEQQRNRAELNRKPVEERKGSASHFVLHSDSNDDDTDGDSGSFVRAHTPKAKVLKPSPQKALRSGIYHLTGKETGDCPSYLSGLEKSKVSDNNHQHRITPKAVKKRPFHNSDYFIAGASPSLSRISNVQNDYLFGNVERMASDFISKSGHKGEKHHQKDNTSMADGLVRNLTEEYTLNGPGTNTNCLHDMPGNLCSYSKNPNFDDTLSTIHGSDDECLEQDCDIDHFVDDKSMQSKTQVSKRGYMSIGHHSTVADASKLIQYHKNNENQNYRRNANSLSENKNVQRSYKQNGQRIQSFQSTQQRAEGSRGWKSSVMDYIAHQDGQTDRSRFRASTPILQDKMTPLISLNSSLSTIVSHQDKEVESDSSDDDWETKTIRDVDVL